MSSWWRTCSLLPTHTHTAPCGHTAVHSGHCHPQYKRPRHNLRHCDTLGPHIAPEYNQGPAQATSTWTHSHTHPSPQSCNLVGADTHVQTHRHPTVESGNTRVMPPPCRDTALLQPLTHTGIFLPQSWRKGALHPISSLPAPCMLSSSGPGVWLCPHTSVSLGTERHTDRDEGNQLKKGFQSRPHSVPGLLGTSQCLHSTVPHTPHPASWGQGPGLGWLRGAR